MSRLHPTVQGVGEGKSRAGIGKSGEVVYTHHMSAARTRRLSAARSRRRFDGVLFDLDGTLADTLEDLADAMNRVLRGEGLPEHGYAEYQRMIGHGIHQLVRNALPGDERDEAAVTRCFTLMMADYGEHSLVKTHLYPGVTGLLRALRDAGLALAVLSNKADAPTRRIVAALFADDTFAAVAGAQPDVPLKPDPAGALLAAASLGLEPGRMLYVGDSPTDMRTARAAGMTPVGVSWGFRTRDELAEAGASAVLDDPLELLGLLG
jgi:phosphoglycolate phosphatase